MPRSRFQKQTQEASTTEPVKEAESAVQLRDPAAEVRVSPPLSPEAEILAKAQAGDHHAFAHLYSLHKRRIYSLCLRMVGNVAEAEDLTQEAFLAASSQNRDVSRRLGLFHMASSLVDQRRFDASAEKGPAADVVGRGYGAVLRRRSWPQLWRSRSIPYRFHRPSGPGKSCCGPSGWISSHFCASRC